MFRLFSGMFLFSLVLLVLFWGLGCWLDWRWWSVGILGGRLRFDWGLCWDALLVGLDFSLDLILRCRWEVSLIISFDRASSNIFKLTPSINLNETNSTIKCLIKMDKSMYIVLFSPKSQKNGCWTMKELILNLKYLESRKSSIYWWFLRN